MFTGCRTHTYTQREYAGPAVRIAANIQVGQEKVAQCTAASCVTHLTSRSCSHTTCKELKYAPLRKACHCICAARIDRSDFLRPPSLDFLSPALTASSSMRTSNGSRQHEDNASATRRSGVRTEVAHMIHCQRMRTKPCKKHTDRETYFQLLMTGLNHRADGMVVGMYDRRCRRGL